MLLMKTIQRNDFVVAAAGAGTFRLCACVLIMVYQQFFNGPMYLLDQGTNLRTHYKFLI